MHIEERLRRKTPRFHSNINTMLERLAAHGLIEPLSPVRTKLVQVGAAGEQLRLAIQLEVHPKRI